MRQVVAARDLPPRASLDAPGRAGDRAPIGCRPCRVLRPGDRVAMLLTDMHDADVRRPGAASGLPARPAQRGRRAGRGVDAGPRGRAARPPRRARADRRGPARSGRPLLEHDPLDESMCQSSRRDRAARRSGSTGTSPRPTCPRRRPVRPEPLRLPGRRRDHPARRRGADTIRYNHNRIMTPAHHLGLGARTTRSARTSWTPATWRGCASRSTSRATRSSPATSARSGRSRSSLRKSGLRRPCPRLWRLPGFTATISPHSASPWWEGAGFRVGQAQRAQRAWSQSSTAGLPQASWPGEDPIGKRFKWGIATSEAPWQTVIGVVGDVSDGPPGAAPLVHIYAPIAKSPTERSPHPVTARCAAPWLMISSDLDPTSLVDTARRAVAEIDPALAVSRVQTLAQLQTERTAPQRFSAMMLGSFAAGALLLAAIGLSGVLAFAVSSERGDRYPHHTDGTDRRRSLA